MEVSSRSNHRPSAGIVRTGMSIPPQTRAGSANSEDSWIDGENTLIDEEQSPEEIYDEKKRRLVVDMRVAYLILISPKRSIESLNDQAQADFKIFRVKNDGIDDEWLPAKFQGETIQLQHAALEAGQERVRMLTERAKRDSATISELYGELEAAGDWMEEFNQGGREQQTVITKLREALRAAREESKKFEEEDARSKRIIMKLEKRLKTRAEEDGRFNLDSLIDGRSGEVVVDRLRAGTEAQAKDARGSSDYTASIGLTSTAPIVEELVDVGASDEIPIFKMVETSAEDERVRADDATKDENPALLEGLVLKEDTVSKKHAISKENRTIEERLSSKGDSVLEGEEKASIQAESTELKADDRSELGTLEDEDALFEAEFKRKAAKAKARGWWDDAKPENDENEEL